MRSTIFTLLACLPLLTGIASCGSGDTEQSMTEQRAEELERLEEVQEEHIRRDSAPNQDSVSFGQAFALFMTALQASDTTTLNLFIHPDHGLWIIEQPGAMPRMTRITDIRDFKREYQDRSFFTIRDEVKTCDLREEAWPTFDCADLDYDKGQSGYSKDGCFVSDPAKFQKSGYWDYASLSEAEIKQIKATLPLLQRSVLHTATSFEFHFGHVDGQWLLLFAKLIYPCSA
ncbi:hypothetical protein [Pontibacter sp. HSC-36F09]|uniref:hypothetical protein n=1 Tax=Pontibacter sp. HSC-36F09 TaxID=2910966 RepID=UPI0020A154F1|nr:hypothetical protein [Pontibacter sp. HSC-36F09]MCP2043319.1 hypothetical protein [Pontibacter sp. HSC-36F09]